MTTTPRKRVTCLSQDIHHHLRDSVGRPRRQMVWSMAASLVMALGGLLLGDAARWRRAIAHKRQHFFHDLGGRLRWRLFVRHQAARRSWNASPTLVGDRDDGGPGWSPAHLRRRAQIARRFGLIRLLLHQATSDGDGCEYGSQFSLVYNRWRYTPNCGAAIAGDGGSS